MGNGGDYPIGYGKFQGSLMCNVPIWYLEWVCKTFKREDAKWYLASVEIDRRIQLEGFKDKTPTEGKSVFKARKILEAHEEDCRLLSSIKGYKIVFK